MARHASVSAPLRTARNRGREPRYARQSPSNKTKFISSPAHTYLKRAGQQGKDPAPRALAASSASSRAKSWANVCTWSTSATLLPHFCRDIATSSSFSVLTRASPELARGGAGTMALFTDSRLASGQHGDASLFVSIANSILSMSSNSQTYDISTAPLLRGRPGAVLGELCASRRSLRGHQWRCASRCGSLTLQIRAVHEQFADIYFDISTAPFLRGRPGAVLGELCASR
jgi:hypothetical protein